MFGNSKKKRKIVANSLIGQDTEVHGDIVFKGGLHVDGTVKGNIIAAEESESVLTVSELGCIEGEVRVPDIVLNGTVKGDVHSCEHIELAVKAHVQGNVYYNLIEVAMGAEVNGSLVHAKDAMPKAPPPPGVQSEKSPG